VSATAADLYIESAETGRITTLRLKGTLDIYTAEKFTARTDEALKRGARSLIVDLADVVYLDSEVGIGALLRALRRMQSANGTLLLVDVPGPVRKAIRIKGLGLVIQAFASEEEAVAFLTSGLWVR
jgi:anti-sigma B factor antagonist